MSKTDDKIHLNKTLVKEKWERKIYSKWAAEIKLRLDEGSCPKCAHIKWVPRGSGFHKTWMCDNCGLIVTRKDWVTGQIWFDYMKKFAIDEIKRRKKMKRKNLDIKNYERDGV